MTYLTLEELLLRDEEKLPTLPDGSLHTDRITAALEDASNIIRTYLPSLIDDDGVPVIPPARIAGSLKPITRDLVLYLLNERPGEEAAEARYERAVKLLIALGGGERSDGEVISGPDPLAEEDAELLDGRSEWIPGSQE